MSNPAVSALARSEVLVQLAGTWLGRPAIPFRATLFEKTPGTNWLIPWHQDTALPLARRFDAPGWGPWSEKSGITYAHAPAWALSRVIALRVHLDPSQADNGPLRVTPGSHAAGVLSESEVSRWVSRVEPVTCLTPRGGVVAMRPLLVHASSKVLSDEPRRVLHIEYADSLDLADGIRVALA
jgi:ectoine hydroxylase-related dioxygenase (phytanoyl-CoA dioxygenase family)